MIRKLLFALPLVVGLSAQAFADPFSSAPIGYSGSPPGTGGGGGGGTPGGSSGQVQYNAAGSFSGISGATTDGTTLTLVAPILGTPASVDLTNGVNLPISTGVSGLGTSVATFLGTPTSANLAAAVTNETGSGLLVFGTTPTLITPILGAATGTSIALGGATIGANAFAVTGTAAISGTLSSAAFTSSGTILAGASSNVGFTGRSLISSAADSNIALTNNAGSSFGLLQLGGTTSSFPALKRSTTSVQIRLADDSAFSTISTGGSLLNGSSSGVISVLPQAAAGTYNFNLPTTAGTAGQLLASGGGVGAPMTWVNAGAGTVTSISAGQGITTGGSAITATGTVSTTEIMGNSGAVITGTTYTINTTTDAATQLVFTGASPSAFTLGSPVSGVGFDIVNRGSASVTVSATGNINGAATLVIAASSWAHIFAQSTTTWNAEVPGGSGSGLTVGSTAIASGTSGRVLYDNAGVLGELTTTGTGNVVFDTSPTLVTPALGTPASGVATNLTGLPLTTGVTGILPVLNGGTGISSLGTGVATFLGTPSSANLAAALTDETGTGVAVFSASPALTGTATAAALTLSSTLTTNVTGVASNCLQVNTSGVVAGSGAACGVGTVNAGTTPGVAYFATSSSAVSDGGSAVVNIGGINVTSSTTTGLTNGMYLSSANVIQIRAASANKFQIASGGVLFASGLVGATAGSPKLADAAASSTVPTLIPNQSGTTTGWGAQASGNMSGIVGGVEKIRLTTEGVQYKQATAPVPTGTGSPTIATGSTDEAGEITAGASATSVIITFNLTHTNAPFCVVTQQGNPLAAFAYTLSSTAITITQTATSGNKINYRCSFP